MAIQKIRKQFYISKRLAAFLKALSKARRVSEAAVIRQAIEQEVVRESTSLAPGDHSAIDDFARLALSKRAQTTEREPYRWNRENIYAERSNHSHRKK